MAGKGPRPPWERTKTGGRPSAAHGRGPGGPGGPGGPRQSSKPARTGLDSELHVIGRHAVMATLEYQRTRAIELFHGPSPDLLPIVQKALAIGIPVHPTDLDGIDALAGGREQGSAQGVVLSCSPFPYLDVDDLIDPPPVTLALDGIEDPRNLGAACRAAFALGAGLVVVPSDRAAAATASAIKASAGAMCRIPIARTTNFRRALERLKEQEVWIVGAEADGDRAPWDIDTSGKVCIVIGGEDRGLRRLTREACDFVCAVPMAAKDMSLNAADAATLLLYEVRRQRAKPLRR